MATLNAPQSVWSHVVPGTIIFSPRVEDLNGDGDPEVIAAHGVESPPSGGVIALQASTGELLWDAPASQQLYGSPIFIDITHDGVKDVFVGGRNAAFEAIDGASGEVLWEFDSDRRARASGWYNFYTASPIPDQTGDESPDLLLANGGYDQAAPADANRPPGHLMILDSANGSILVSAPTPDLHETYMSTLVIGTAASATGVSDLDSLSVIFGTGGETLPGSLWRVKLSSLLSGNLDDALPLARSDSKGFMAPPSLADLNQDGRLDILVAAFDGRLLAIDGATDELLWEQFFGESESYSSPALGFFDTDGVPDAFVTFLRGEYPNYSSAVHAVVAGATGEVIWQEEDGNLSMAGDVAIDLDRDGIDEVIFTSSDTTAGERGQAQLRLLDAARGASRSWEANLGAAMPVSPWVGELDQDGCVDLVLAQIEEGTGAARLTRFRIAAPSSAEISWGGYLGTRFDAVLSRTR